MKVTLTDWNIQDYLKTPEDRAFYLEAAIGEAIESNDMNFLAEALGDVAKAMGGESIATFMNGIAAVIKAIPMPTPKTARRKTVKRKLTMA